MAAQVVDVLKHIMDPTIPKKGRAILLGGTGYFPILKGSAGELLDFMDCEQKDGACH